MSRIITQKIRKHLSKKMRDIEKLDGGSRVSLKDLDEILTAIRTFKADAKNKSNEHLAPYLDVVSVQLSALSSYAMGMLLDGDQPLPSDWLRDKSSKNPNSILESNLVQIVNHGLSVLALIERGLTNSARSLLRSVIETTWVTIIFCGQRDKAQLYAKDIDISEAKQIWQHHFSPKMMMAGLNRIENNLGLPPEFTEYLKGHRQETYNFHTQSSHCTSMVLQILSMDIDMTEEHKQDEAIVTTGLFGFVGVAARTTLLDLIDVLGYTLFMFYWIAEKKYSYISPETNGYWNKARAFTSGSFDLWFGATDFKLMGNLWADNY